jgi:predicted ArsR family transcriptional regulator
MDVDDTAVLEAVRECDPATAGAVADRLSIPVAAAADALDSLAADGRLERDGGDEGEGERERWRIARDPRIDESVERMADRLGRERPDGR